ncbi:Homeobox-leucine zipper protein HDG2 [Glycine soja]|uniref:Homeobox-leucine zipper protein HDG2 n=1 Tax=Glycine soja TaxID=3848 RepID=A0A0B2RNL0_GLYSO|nr:Homeobox-leucine zipper protein HDG2 [Glycine soja]
MMKLAERMVISFCAGVSASTAHTWTTLSGTSADDDPGRPPGIVLSAATSFWLHVPPKRVFDFLRDENSRNELLKSIMLTKLPDHDFVALLSKFILFGFITHMDFQAWILSIA